MDNVTLSVAFFAGIVSFLSPCVLPLVPGYVSFLSGMSFRELENNSGDRLFLKGPGLSAIFFVIGFSIVFIALGASATFIGKILSAYTGIFTRVSGVLLVILGLHLLGILRIGVLNYEKRFQVNKIKPGLFGALLVGVAFGFGWTPCIGPILAGILAIAATQETMNRGILLLAAYSIGLGIPFIVTGFAVGAFIKFFEKYKKFIRSGEIVAGVFLIILGGLIFTNNLSVVLRYVPDLFFEFSK